MKETRPMPGFLLLTELVAQNSDSTMHAFMADHYPKVYLYRRLVQAKLFIDRHYAKKIDLDNIADEAFFSKFHFIRQFKKIYGKTPHQYLQSVRIEQAKQLLDAGVSVLDVSMLVGFESPTSFSGLFKRLVGTSPSSYQAYRQLRKMQLSNAPLTFIPNCFAETRGWKKSNIEDMNAV
jgi:AraC-like DNA-binding protein